MNDVPMMTRLGAAAFHLRTDCLVAHHDRGDVEALPLGEHRLHVRLGRGGAAGAAARSSGRTSRSVASVRLRIGGEELRRPRAHRRPGPARRRRCARGCRSRGAAWSAPTVPTRRRCPRAAERRTRTACERSGADPSTALGMTGADASTVASATPSDGCARRIFHAWELLSVVGCDVRGCAGAGCAGARCETASGRQQMAAWGAGIWAQYGRGAAASSAETARFFWGELHPTVMVRTHAMQARAHHRALRDWHRCTTV